MGKCDGGGGSKSYSSSDPVISCDVVGCGGMRSAFVFVDFCCNSFSVVVLN